MSSVLVKGRMLLSPVNTVVDVLFLASAWCKICNGFFHNTVRFWWTTSHNQRRTTMYYSLLSIRPCSKNSWCITPLESKKTVSKTFTFDRPCSCFFGFGYKGRFYWDDYALVSMQHPYTHISSPTMTVLKKSRSPLNNVDIS